MDGSPEGWMEALRDGCPAPDAGTGYAWHLWGITAPSPCSDLCLAVQGPTVPARLCSPGADPQGLILTCCRGFLSAASSAPWHCSEVTVWV